MIQRRKKVVIYIMLLVWSIAFFISALYFSDFVVTHSVIFGSIGLLLFCMIIYLAFRWFRCPYCCHLLVIQVFLLDKVLFACPHCGKQIEVR